MPGWIGAGLWGLLAGSALVLGAAIGYFVNVPARLVAAVMAFGSGVLISTLSFELMEEAFHHGGIGSTAFGFVVGAVAFTAVDYWLAQRGARHRKHSGKRQASEAEHRGSGMAIAAGALLDGIPESIVIGLSVLKGGAVAWVTVLAVFLSNLPEGLSSASGMKHGGRGARYVLGLWTGIALISGIAAIVGNLAFAGASANVVSATTAVAAGAILAMLVDTMIPEAFEVAHDFAGLVTVAGFLVAFALSKLS